MSEDLQAKIVKHLKGERYRPMKVRGLAHALGVHEDDSYPQFKRALRALVDEGKVVYQKGGTLAAKESQQPEQQGQQGKKQGGARGHGGPDGAAKSHGGPGKAKKGGHKGDVVVGLYRQNKRGFGFVMPSEPAGHEDLFIPPGWEGGAITGDTVRAKITGAEMRDGKQKYEGRIIGIVQRTEAKFVGTLTKQHGQWLVLPDGNDFREPIECPDAASRHIKPGTKVAVELTRYPEEDLRAQGVITDVLGEAGEKDVDLRSVIIQYDLPADFPEECKLQARQSLERFNRTLEHERRTRLDLTDQLICTIDPDDAKDYDDAISIRRLDNGNWQLGVHIADVAFFVEPRTPLDGEAAERGNSVYFPGYVIPMLPEVLSNGVCSLQEGVARLCKSAFIEIDSSTGRPVASKFANTIIKSARRLRYREAQAILDRKLEVPHPDGNKSVEDYGAEVIGLLDQMDELARLIQKRRHHDGQLVLGLPEVDLVLDEEGKVAGAVPEDESYTHTIIEMFMVEANEAVARLLDSIDVPFLRRAHAEPPMESTDRLRQFVQVAGYKLGKAIDRKTLQTLLETVKDRPEAFAVNLAVLRSLARAEYSPEAVGHYALASEHYCHFTSPIRRYADLTIHRLLDEYFKARERMGGRTERLSPAQRKKVQLENAPTYDELVQLGKHLSFTERRADDAENELRQVKLLELLSGKIGEEFHGVVTSVTKYGLFVQLQEYLCDGLIRYEDLLDDFWEVDERGGYVRGRRTGKRIGIGDLATVRVVKVDVPRRELDLAITELRGRAIKAVEQEEAAEETESRGRGKKHGRHERGGGRAGGGRSGGGHGGGRGQAARGSSRSGGGGRRGGHGGGHGGGGQGGHGGGKRGGGGRRRR